MALSRCPSSTGQGGRARSTGDNARFDDDTESISRGTFAGSDHAEPGPDQLSSYFYRGDLPSEFWDDVLDLGLHPEQISQWLSRLERGADQRVIQTFKKGKSVPRRDDAPRPAVGSLCLPTADKPTVARLEESNMVEKEPDRKGSIWRQNTASTLLNGRTVNRDLSFLN